MDRTQPGPPSEGAYPPVGRAPVEAAAVLAHQDRTVASFAYRKIHGSGSAGNERDGGGPSPFTHDPQSAMPPLETKVFDIGGAGLRPGRLTP